MYMTRGSWSKVQKTAHALHMHILPPYNDLVFFAHRSVSLIVEQHPPRMHTLEIEISHSKEYHRTKRICNNDHNDVSHVKMIAFSQFKIMAEEECSANCHVPKEG